MSVEFTGVAFALLTTCIVLTGLLGAIGAQLQLTSLARDAARAASLQADGAAAERAARSVVAPYRGVRVALTSDHSTVTVRLDAPVVLPLLGDVVALHARAVALEESPW